MTAVANAEATSLEWVESWAGWTIEEGCISAGFAPDRHGAAWTAWCRYMGEALHFRGLPNEADAKRRASILFVALREVMR